MIISGGRKVSSPDSGAPLRRIPARHLLLLVIAAGILPYICMMARPATGEFSSDSWSYYDLSQTVFTDFYHASVTRAFHERDGYSRSFPPLWPVLIAVTDRVVRQGPATGVRLAALLALLTVIPLNAIAGACLRRRSLAPYAAVAAWCGLLWFPPYWNQTLIGCAIPLTVLLLATAAAGLLRADFPRRWAIA